LKSLPDKSDPNYKYYELKNGYPVLKINQSLGSYFEANLKKRFTGTLMTFCPLSKFKIKKVMS